MPFRFLIPLFQLFPFLKSFQQKPFSKFLPGDYLLRLCFAMPIDQIPCNCQEHEILHQIMPGQQIPSFA